MCVAQVADLHLYNVTLVEGQPHLCPPSGHRIIRSVSTTDTPMPPQERRARERLPYANESRPLLIIGEHAYEIIDIGERGLRASCGDPERWLLGSVVEGSVWFQRDSRVRIQGMVLRAGGGELALRLGGEGIPPRALLDELRYSRRPVA